MLVYFAMLLPALVSSWSQPSAQRRLTVRLVVYFIAMLIFSGLRDRVGPDWYSYVSIFEWSGINREVSTTEPLFIYLNIISRYFGFGIYGVNFVCSLLFLCGVFAFAATTARPWLAIAVVTPYLVFVIGMSGIRQAAALGLCYVAIAFWYRLTMAVKLVLIGVATGFHNSALFFLIFIVFQNQKWVWLKIPFIVAFALVLLTMSSKTTNFERYSSIYLSANLLSPGALQHVLLSTFPAALYLIYLKHIRAAGGDNRLITIASLASIVALPMIVVSSTGVDRLSLYFSFVQMWTYPILLETFYEKRAVLSGWISLGIIAIFVIYFNFSNTSEYYIPYRNILLE